MTQGVTPLVCGRARLPGAAGPPRSLCHLGEKARRNLASLRYLPGAGHRARRLRLLPHGPPSDTVR